MTLQEEAQRYHELGEKFLKESKLTATLEKHGEVLFGGAYAANLMMTGDIDIGVIRDTDFSIEESFEVFRDIFFSTQEYFRSLYIKSDWADPRKGGVYPNGHYIGMRAEIEDEKWKFDIWLISRAERERMDAERFDINRVLLTPKQRETILHFKKYRKDNRLNISSQKIYEAILKDGATDPVLFYKNL